MNKKLGVALVCLALTPFVFAKAQEVIDTEPIQKLETGNQSESAIIPEAQEVTATEPAKTPRPPRKLFFELTLQEQLLRMQQLKERISSGNALAVDYLSLGLCYYVSDEYNLALGTLKEGVAINPSDPNFWWLLGITHKALGNRIESKEAFLEAIRIMKSIPERQDRDSTWIIWVVQKLIE